MRADRFGEMACTRDSRRKQLKNKTPRPQAWVFFLARATCSGVVFFEGSRNDRAAGVAYCARGETNLVLGFAKLSRHHGNRGAVLAGQSLHGARREPAETVAARDQACGDREWSARHKACEQLRVMRHRIDERLPLRNAGHRLHRHTRGVTRRCTRRSLGGRQLCDGVVGRERDGSVEALTRRIETGNDRLHRPHKFAHQRAQFVARQPIGAGLERLIGAAECDHQATLNEQRAKAKRCAQVGLGLVERGAVRPTRQRIDRARGSAQEIVHRGAAGFIALAGGASIASEQPTQLARRGNHGNQIAVDEAQRLQLSHTRRRANRLVCAGKIESGQVNPGRLHTTQEFGAPSIDQCAHQRLAASDPRGDARRINSHAPRALRQPSRTLAGALAGRRSKAEFTQQQQTNAFV